MLYTLFTVILLWVVRLVVLGLPLKFPKFKLQPSRLDIVYGGPGSGKTTYAAFLARKAIASGVMVFSNVPIVGCYKLTKEDIGQFKIPPSLVVIDEAGIEYNNREFRQNFTTGKSGKAASQSAALEWWKKHRHEGCQCIILSQGFDDMDKKLQTLGSHYWIVRHSLIPMMISMKQIRKRPMIDEMTHQPIDYYDFVPLSKRRIFMRPLWKFFDSFDQMQLPLKDWEVYDSTSEL